MIVAGGNETSAVSFFGHSILHFCSDGVKIQGHIGTSSFDATAESSAGCEK